MAITTWYRSGTSLDTHTRERAHEDDDGRRRCEPMITTMPLSVSRRSAEEGRGDQQVGGHARYEDRERASEGLLGNACCKARTREGADYAGARHRGGESDVEAAAGDEMHGEPDQRGGRDDRQ